MPTLPLFVHERLSTEAILKSVQTHKQQLDLFADTKLDLAERVLRAFVGPGPLLTDDRPLVEYFLSLPRDRDVDLSSLKGDAGPYIVK